MSEPDNSELFAKLIDKGFLPHIKPVPMSTTPETWWERPPSSAAMNWPGVVLLLGFLAFVVVMVKL